MVYIVLNGVPRDTENVPKVFIKVIKLWMNDDASLYNIRIIIK